VYLSLPHFTALLLLVSGDIAAQKTFNFNQMDGKFIFVIEKNQFRGEFLNIYTKMS